MRYMIDISTFKLTYPFEYSKKAIIESILLQIISLETTNIRIRAPHLPKDSMTLDEMLKT